jgi:ATP-binding cassette subfamily A (ABC1) protein 3
LAKKGTNAVKGVSFQVKRGEIFALLGINGAGKTSTFNMLVGDETISGGQAVIDDINLTQVFRKPHYLD